MKNYKLLVGITFVSAFLMTSCVSTNKGFQSSPIISRSIHLDPIKADLKVDDDRKLKGESRATYFLSFRVSGDNTFADGINFSTDASAGLLHQLNPFKLAQHGRLNKVRGAAAYKALINSDYDVLVHPKYSITIENYLILKIYKVEVEGYGGKYKNFRHEKQKIVILDDGKEVILQDNK